MSAEISDPPACLQTETIDPVDTSLETNDILVTTPVETYDTPASTPAVMEDPPVNFTSKAFDRTTWTAVKTYDPPICPPICPPTEKTKETLTDLKDGSEIVIEDPGMVISGAEKRQEPDKPTTERNEALRNQILKEMNGGQCFIFESGSTVHLTITRDVNEHHSMVVNKVHGTPPPPPPAADSFTKDEEAAIKKSNRSSGIFRSIFASMRKPSSTSDTKDTKNESLEMTVTKEDRASSVDGLQRQPSEPIIDEEQVFAEDLNSVLHTSPVPHFDTGHDERIGGRRQIKYDGYMRPFPGIDELRYHVEEHYVPVKIFPQSNKAGITVTETIDLHNLFSPENDDDLIQSVVVVAEFGKTALCQYVLNSYSVRRAVFAEFPCDTTLLFRVTLSGSVVTQLKPYLNRIRDRNVILIVDDYNPANKVQEQQLQKLLNREHPIHDAEVGATSVLVLLTTKTYDENSALAKCDRRVELGKFGENEVLEFTSKYANEFKIEEPNDFVQRIKELTGVPMKEINPLVLLTFCLASRRVEEFDFDNILLHCKYMLAWRCQKKSWGHNWNFLIRAFSFRRMPTFEVFNLSDLKTKYSEEAKRIMQESRFYLPTPIPTPADEKTSLHEE